MNKQLKMIKMERKRKPRTKKLHFWILKRHEKQRLWNETNCRRTPTFWESLRTVAAEEANLDSESSSTWLNGKEIVFPNSLIVGSLTSTSAIFVLGFKRTNKRTKPENLFFKSLCFSVLIEVFFLIFAVSLVIYGEKIEIYREDIEKGGVKWRRWAVPRQQW